VAVSTSSATNPTFYPTLPYNFLRDLVPVSGLVTGPFVMVVNPSLPAKNVAEFITYAKANPGKISMASTGAGTAVHLSGELFKVMTGVDMVHVPYRGGAPAITDLISGQVQVLFSDVPGALPAHQGQYATPARGDDGKPVGIPAGCAGLQRDCPRLCVEHLVQNSVPGTPPESSD
jgi:tripartite-type tricarboxylate transporter receptor subunit TctC